MAANSAPSPDDLDVNRKVAELISGYQATCVIVAATQLGVFAQLASGPVSEDALAHSLSVPVVRLHRLMLALRSLSLVEGETSTIALTPMGRALIPNTRGLAELATLVGSEYLAGWSELRTSIQTGQPAFEKVFGMTAWEHRRQHPELGRAFDLMTSGNSASSALGTIAATYDFARARHIIDVGGGRGYFLSAVLTRYPQLRGTLFDQPHVVTGAPSVLAEAGVTDRCTVVGGSFLDDVPAGGDLYILKHILHDWNDDDSIAILRKIRRALPTGGTLVVIEAVLPDDQFQAPGARATIMLDLHMMTILGGCERHVDEYARLVTAAGFELVATIPTGRGPSILEAKAV